MYTKVVQWTLCKQIQKSDRNLQWACGVAIKKYATFTPLIPISVDTTWHDLTSAALTSYTKT